MDGLIRFMNAMGAGKLITVFAVLAGMVGFFFIVFSQVTEPPMGLLYSDMELGEVAEITDRLDAMQVPYRLSEKGDAIFVPNDRITSMRVTLAGEGLGGNIVGYEIFDRSEGLGTTSFVQNVNRVRAVEGELSRTISEITSVSSARVHIVVPERGIFRQDERQPSASIVLKTRRGGLSPGQVRAIQHLVAAAVAGLEPTAISIVDQTGNLLARGGATDDVGAAASAGLAERQQGLENRLRNQIEALLENTVGPGKVRAEVSVQMNLSRITTNSETFNPDAQVVVSQSTTEEITEDRGASTSGAVSVGTNLPDAQDTETGNSGPLSTTSRTEETVNYEVSRTVSTETVEAGEIEKITVAVLVDGTHTANADGSTTYTPRTQAELDQLETLVQSAVGYDANRGDDISVVNLEFAPMAEPEPLPESFNIMGMDTDAIGTLLERIFWGVAGILAFFMVIRPLMSKVIAAIPEPPPPQRAVAAPQGAVALPSPDMGITPELAAAAAAGDAQAIEAFRAAKERGPADNLGVESQIDVATIEGRVQDSALKKVGDIVMRHPDESAAIVRSWLYSD